MHMYIRRVVRKSERKTKRKSIQSTVFTLMATNNNTTGTKLSFVLQQHCLSSQMYATLLRKNVINLSNA